MDGYRAIVVGGGVGGASIAYHLTELGWSEVLLLDRDELTSGSTFHSAGLVGQLRSSVSLTRMMMHGTDLYRRLADETGVDPGWHEVGSLRLAASTERMEELTRLTGWSQTFGLPLELVSVERAHEMFPLFDPAGVEGAVFLPTDGWLDPTGLTLALAAGAKARGAEVRTHARVTDIDVRDGRVRGVVTEEHGPIAADVVVNAGGMFANQIARMAGVEVPVVPFAHQYMLTAPIEGVEPSFPTLRDPDRLVYFRQEAGGTLHVGGYERNPAPWAVADGPPPDFNNKLLPEDWPRFEELAQGASSLVPALHDAEVVKMINGPEAFTPDGEFILGESDVRGFFVAAGFCAHGIAGAGGIGKVIADWIVNGEPEWDLWKMDVRRFGPQYRSRDYALARAHEVYATYYDIHYPGEERQAGRPLKTAPTYARLAELGAEFGEKSGWERVNWFRSNEDPSYEARRPRGWAGEHWSSAICAEHLACRERVALFDESSFAKIEVTGAGAAAFLQRLCANDVDRSVGSVVYTQMLNRRGGIECDLTVTRQAGDRFLLVSGTAFGNHDIGWIRKQLADGGDADVSVRDVTASLACFGLWGPRARDVLGSVTSTDLSNDAFPYMTAQPVVAGHVPCWALRVTYVGELGWELYPSVEFGVSLFDTLIAAGEPHGLMPAGYRAIDSLRLEKGYLAWGSDITPEEHPFEAGLGFAVRMDSPGFVGEAALQRIGAEGFSRRLACALLDDPNAMVLGNEPVFHDGDVVARVTSGGIGYAIGSSIALTYLPGHLAAEGTPLSIEVFGERVPASVVSAPLWDRAGERIRA
ncbi:MAG: FAD-dependent oxidoreductase [Actinomycetota bacterium]|nr:FAD-dependent oxidoreductase [Actinomycetota bacterium]MDH5313917.1 FAD-dependent oxidoreductase [Actinomycetota bacterium]